MPRVLDHSFITPASEAAMCDAAASAAIAPTRSSVVTRVRERIGNPLNWHPADRCLFVGLILLPFGIWYWLVVQYGRAHLQAAPYLNASFLDTAWRVQSGFVAAFVLLVLSAMACRRSRSECRWLQRATMLLYVVAIFWGSYALGLHTNLFSGLNVVAATMGWALF